MEISTEDNTKLKDLHKSLTEVRTTNRFILRRLNHVVDNGTSGSCCFSNHVSSNNTYKDLETRLGNLESNQDKTEDSITQSKQHLKEIQIIVKQLQDDKHAIRDKSIPSLETNPLKEMSSVANYETLGKHVKQPLSAVGITEEAITEAENKDTNDEIRKTTDTSLENNSETQYQKVNATHRAETNKDNNTSSPGNNIKIQVDTINPHTKADENITEVQAIAKNVPTEPDNALDLSTSNNRDIAEECSKPEQKNKSSTKTEKPNFCSRFDDAEGKHTHLSIIDTPVVLEQNKKEFHPHHTMWDQLASQEYLEAMTSGLKDLEGAHTVFCIDISLSMSCGDAWKHVTSFFNSYIGGLEEVTKGYGFKDEHIAIATFGHDTRVIQRFTNDMSKIKTALGNIKLGGPSPLYGGLEMATKAAASSHKPVAFFNGIPVPTKIVLITDGELTDSCLYQGPDKADLNKHEQTKEHVLETMQFFESKPSIDFFCIPVGKPNMDFLNLMTGVANGKILKYTDGRQFARRLYLTTITTLTPFENPFGKLTRCSSFSGGDYLSLSTEDKKQIEDIRNSALSHMKAFARSSNDPRMYVDTDAVQLPVVGTRVRRGPDWSCSSQDSNGPGTIIGQHEAGRQLWVEWDVDGETDVYHYGGNDCYDLLIVDEPRNVSDGKLAVGCKVKPGQYFKFSETKVGPQERGVAIKINRDKQTVRVKWANKERGKYKYSDNQPGTMEVEMCTPFRKQESHTFEPERVPLRKTVNKNKNMNV